MISTLSGYLRGEGKLWKAFWLILLLPTLLMTYLLPALYVFVPLKPTNPFLYAFVILAATTYTVGNIATWQCSRNCKRPLWTWLVRIYILFPLAAELYFDMTAKAPFLSHGSFNLVSISVLFHVSFFVFLFIYIVQTCQNETTSMDNRKKIFLVLMGLSIFSNDITKSLSFSDAIQNMRANNALNIAETYFSQKNYEEAAKWYQIAINYGSSYAKNNLAIMYEKGNGVPKDMKKAMQLYREAAQEGDYMAEYNIGQTFELGQNGEQSYKKAFEHYLIAAEHGNGCAQNDLGMFYAAGTGIPADPALATHWLQKAAAFGLNNDSFQTKQGGTETLAITAFVQYQLAQARHETIPISLTKSSGLLVAQNLADYFQHTCRD